MGKKEKFPKVLFARHVFEDDENFYIVNTGLEGFSGDDGEFAVYELVRQGKYRTVVQEVE